MTITSLPLLAPTPREERLDIVSALDDPDALLLLATLCVWLGDHLKPWMLVWKVQRCRTDLPDGLP